jgi:pimeloyl-ACP methyl ester carboxylesterase
MPVHLDFRSLSWNNVEKGHFCHEKEFTVILKGSEHHICARLRDSGGELVFFIHGLGCAGEAFDDAFDSPFMKDYSLLAPDLPGFGSSPLPEDFSCSMEDHAAVCLEILRQVSHEKIHLVGHSMGGAVGLLLAGRLGKRLASFASVEGNLIRRDCSVRRRLAASHGGYRHRLLGMIDAGILTGAEKSLLLWKKWISDSRSRPLTGAPAHWWIGPAVESSSPCSGRFSAVRYSFTEKKIRRWLC